MYVLALLFSIFISFMYIVISMSDKETDGMFVAIALLVLAMYDLHKHGDMDALDEPWYKRSNQNHNSYNGRGGGGGSYSHNNTSYDQNYNYQYSSLNRNVTTGSENAKLLGDMHTMKNKSVKIEKETKKDNVNGDKH